MSIFSQAINDIFAVPDFQETLTAGNQAITVVSYSANTDTQFTEYGLDDGNTISVTVKCSDWTPKRGDRVVFRGKDWKVSTIYTDSHDLTHTVSLKGETSK